MLIDAGLVFVGWITRCHGIRGELKMLEGEGASGAWQAADEIFVGESRSSATRFRVNRLRAGTKFVIVALEGVDDRDKAETLKGHMVFVPRKQLPEPEEDAFYASDLLGMQVRDQQARQFGVLKEIFDNGAHDIYVVRKGSVEILIPVVEGVVIKVDRDLGEIVVNPPEGLPGL